MKIGSITVCPVRQERMHRAKLDDVDYGDSKAVQRARNEITYLGPWDTVVDISEAGAKHEALERLADVVLREKAARWQQGGTNRVLCEEMAKLDRREVQARFLEMLSPESRQAILAKPEETEEGIRFAPDTQTELDNVLSITFSHEEGEKLVQSGDVADAWQTARTHELEGAKCRNEAQDLRSNGSHSLAANACRKAAEHFSAAGRNTEAAEAYEQAASDLMADGPDHADDGRSLAAAEALDAAAERWRVAGRHANAATCWHRQAEHLTTLGRLDEAAYCTEMEMVQRDLDERNSPGAELHKDVLSEIASWLPNSGSLQAFSLVNRHWNSTVAHWQGQARTAAEAASHHVIESGLSGRGPAMRLIRGLPTFLRLEAFLQLIDRVFINISPTRRFSRAQKRHIFVSICTAASDLKPSDRRKLFTKLVACASYIDSSAHSSFPSNGSIVWEECFDGIRKTNAAEPRDMGPAVVALVTNIPEDYLRDGTQVSELIGEIGKLENSDPHKMWAQTTLVDRLFAARENIYGSKELELDRIFPKA